jgi:hypothetical protein
MVIDLEKYVNSICFNIRVGRNKMAAVGLLNLSLDFGLMAISKELFELGL